MLWPTLLLLLLIIFPLWDYLRRKKHHDQVREPSAGPNVSGNVLAYQGNHDERIMGYALANVPKRGCKYRNWKCDHPPKFLRNDALDVFRETSFKVAPLVDFPATAMATIVNVQMNPNPYMIDAHDMLKVTDLLTMQHMDCIYSLLGRRQEVLIQTLHYFTTVCGLRREDLQMEPLTLQLNNDCDYDELEQKRRQAMWELLLLQGTSGKAREEDTLIMENPNQVINDLVVCLYDTSGQTSGQEGLDDEKADSLPVRHCLNELEFLECVVKEPLNPTVSTFDCNLKQYVEIRGKLIPVGTNITVGIYALLRDPHEYEARRRHEEQYQQKQRNLTNPFANVLLFSAGPRVLEMRSAISKVLQNYKLLPLPLSASPRAAMSPLSITGIHLS